MVVKNILVDNKEEFLDCLIRELIKLNISYVLIDNEIHFLNSIYRFYTKKDIKIIIQENKNVLDTINFEVLKESLDYLPKKDMLLNKESTYPKINKKYIKEQNRQANMKIKRR
jgi:hypothetical protein